MKTLLLIITLAITSAAQTVTNPAEIFAPNLTVPVGNFVISFDAVRAKKARSVALVFEYDPTIIEINGCTPGTLVINPVLTCQQTTPTSWYIAITSVWSFAVSQGTLVNVNARSLASGTSPLRIWVGAFRDRTQLISTIATDGSVVVTN